MGNFLDKDEDTIPAFYPSFPGEKPPAGYDKSTLESVEADKPISGTTSAEQTQFDLLNKPVSSVSSTGETTADFTTAFANLFGSNPPKELISAYTKELQNLQASRSTKRVGKNEDIVIQGVSPQEQKNILNKYLTQYATSIVELSKIGDVAATAALQKGNFGLTYIKLKNAYADNGIPFNTNSLSKLTIESAITPDRLTANLNLINLQAKTYFPALSDKIDKGYTVKQLLSPYLQTRANILEEDADGIDLKELQSIARDPKGLVGLYDYEISLRKDPKWRFTKNAQDSLGGLARDLTRMFGLAG